jgi:AraC-like DNA-binding protein
MQAADYFIEADIENMPLAIPKLIEAAVATFDVDPDTSRRYLWRASALLTGRRDGLGAEYSASRSESRGGLLSWQLNRIVDYIDLHLADKIAASELAALINMSLGQLFRAFKLSVGLTPFHYITKRRVELASKMMMTTQESLSHIALACGLCDQSHLCRVFRSIVGMSPSTWRRATPQFGINKEKTQRPTASSMRSSMSSATQQEFSHGILDHR